MATAGPRQVEIVATNAGAVHPVDVDPRRRTSYFDANARRSRRWFPWIVSLFVVSNVVVFVVTMGVNNCPKNTGGCVARFLGRFSFQPMKENPLLGPSSITLLKMGALDVHKIVHENQGWRIIACIWLHGGVFHILANMLGLLIIGIPLEKEFGIVRIGLLYIISGVGGSLLSVLFVDSGISVGASGALFGLLGGMLSELITNWTIYNDKCAALTSLVVIIAINLVVGLLPRVDNFAHIGGFVSGFFLGFIFLIRPHFGYISQKNLPSTYRPLSATRKHKLYQYILWILAAILLVIGFVVGFVLLYHGVDASKRCSWCHYLNCIPTSKWSCNQQTISCTSILLLKKKRKGDSSTFSFISRAKARGGEALATRWPWKEMAHLGAFSLPDGLLAVLSNASSPCSPSPPRRAPPRGRHRQRPRQPRAGPRRGVAGPRAGLPSASPSSRCPPPNALCRTPPTCIAFRARQTHLHLRTNPEREREREREREKRVSSTPDPRERAGERAPAPHLAGGPQRRLVGVLVVVPRGGAHALRPLHRQLLLRVAGDRPPALPPPAVADAQGAAVLRRLRPAAAALGRLPPPVALGALALARLSPGAAPEARLPLRRRPPSAVEEEGRACSS